MKYRRLTKEELDTMAEDFAIFLAANSIDNKEWDKIKAQDDDKTDALLDLFSDIVFDKALTSAKHLERISETEIYCYLFLPSQAHMLSVRLLNPDLNLLELETFKKVPSLLAQGKAELIQGTKTYTKEREAEMFDLMQQGAVIANSDTYQTLLSLL